MTGFVYCLLQDKRNPLVDDDAMWLVVKLEEIHAEVKAEFRTHTA